MKFKLNFSRALISICALYILVGSWGQIKAQKESLSFEVGKETFLLNGEPFIIKAAELHYPRIPCEYWDQRIKMCKSLGMNTICLYTFWNVHETEEDVFDFEGNNNIRHFIELCKENGLYVILRPGPYVCAEWEMGGLPWWLLKKKDISLRDSDPYFLERVEIFEEKLASQISDLLIGNGGPIIMIQVENEYGAFGNNKPYVSTIRDILRKNYGNNILMFQCDWSSNFTNNGLDDLVWTMNFGTGTDIDSQFMDLKTLRPDSPLMCSEFWSGWFDKWGAPHETRPAEEMVNGIEEMLSKNISFSLYMSHGGTNWGHWAGANSPGYSPDVTSYDYDAPINESGNPTHKFWLLKEALQKFSTDSLPDLPTLIKPISLDTIKFEMIAPLWDNLPTQFYAGDIKPMEDFNQGYGSILYSTVLPDIDAGTILTINDPHDYAQVFLNGEYVGKLDRRLGEKEIKLPSCRKGSSLNILVEAMGRINFGVAIKDYKGITKDVILKEPVYSAELYSPLNEWWINLLPDTYEFYTGMNFKNLSEFEKERNGRYPRGVYKATFTTDFISDTFLNFETWGKGLVYLNGKGLGRIWEIGPQQTLYVPGVWLNEGENEIMVFDIIGPKECYTYGRNTPILDQLISDNIDNSIEVLDLGNLTPVFGGAFPQSNGWQRQIFDKPVNGRYLTIEIISAYDDFTTISEFYLLNEIGERLNRENWSVYFANSLDTATGNHSAEKIFDLQESTYWKSGKGMPQKIVIDLGSQETVGGIEYLPSIQKGNPGQIKEYKIYLSETPL